MEGRLHPREWGGGRAVSGNESKLWRACTCHIHFPDVLLIVVLDPKQTLPSLQNLEPASPSCKCLSLEGAFTMQTVMLLWECGSSGSRAGESKWLLISPYSLPDHFVLQNQSHPANLHSSCVENYQYWHLGKDKQEHCSLPMSKNWRRNELKNKPWCVTFPSFPFYLYFTLAWQTFSLYHIGIVSQAFRCGAVLCDK